MVRFDHSVSRALDPQVHAHLLISQVVKDSGGKMHALYNTAIYKDQALITQVY